MNAKKPDSPLGILLLTGLLTLGACSSNNKTNSDSELDESPASFSARAAINNGYYLSRSEEFDSEGLLIGGVAYGLNVTQNQIEGRDLDDETFVDRLYRYDANGDLNSVSFLSSNNILAPVGDEIQTISIERENGALKAINVDYLIGNEVDNRTTFTYDEAGKPLSSVKQYIGTGDSEEQRYNYENSVLVSLSSTDIEFPGVVVTNTITRDEQGRVGVVDTTYDPQNALVNGRAVYSYDQNGNVSEISYQSSEGSVQLREVFTYEITSESVFNLNNYEIYYLQQ